jgi:hypothetical protein
MPGTDQTMNTVELWEVRLGAPATARAQSHAALRDIVARGAGRASTVSLSHTDGLALVAVSDCPIGVDVEHVGGAPADEELEDLATLTLSNRERRELEAVGRTERPARWLQLWTRKEAALKARGPWLVDPAIRDIDALARGISDLDLGCDYVGAIAVDGPAAPVVRRVYRSA